MQSKLAGMSRSAMPRTRPPSARSLRLSAPRGSVKSSGRGSRRPAKLYFVCECLLLYFIRLLGRHNHRYLRARPGALGICRAIGAGITALWAA